MMAETYDVAVKLNERHVVHSAFIRFRGLLHQLGISPHKPEVLAIKLEIDTNPPAKAGLGTTIIQHHVAVHLQHHDKASLLAGKLHAILQREYVKGRDWYDLYWCLGQSQWASPNVAMLNQVLTQFGWEKGAITDNNWRGYVLERLKPLDWAQVVVDVQRLLMTQEELTVFNKDTIKNLLAFE